MGARDLGELMAAMAAVAEQEDVAREAALPHLVVCIDVASGSRSYSGPYPSRGAAESAAQYEATVEAGSDCRLRFVVEPVFPPIDYHLRGIRRNDTAR
jgi:hypothetical protein